MTLPLNLVADAGQLTAWARSRQADDRERLLNKLSDLCVMDPSASNPAVNDLLQDLLLTLVSEAERDIRRRLAERLASEPWAPHGLIATLALDEIDIARPVIAASPVLTDADLVRLLVEATVEHQIEVARRPNIGPRVVDAVITRSEPSVLAALAGNPTAEIDEAGLAWMVECARRMAALRAPLSRHPGLSTVLAGRLYAWVGASLRDQLSARFDIDPALLTPAVAGAAADAHAGRSTPLDDRDADREEMERRLIAKLSASSQLRPGYLLRALNERRASLFVQALSALSGLSPDDIRKAMTSDHPELLAYACVAVGVDKSVFPTVLTGVRALTGGHPREAADSRRRIDAAFQLRHADAARAAFRAALTPDPLPIAV